MQAADNITMEARDIIKAVGLTYAKMESYQDVGTVKISRSEGVVSESELSFQTYFARPQFFRFETIQKNRPTEAHFVLWCDGQKVARQSNGYTQQLSENALFRNPIKDLERVLSSLPEAQPVVRLLLDKLKGPKLTELPDFKLIEEELCAGTACGRLQSTDGKESTDVWISKADYKIVKLVHRSIEFGNDETLKVSHQPQFSKKVLLVYEYNFENTRVNEPVPVELFQIPKK